MQNRFSVLIRRRHPQPASKQAIQPLMAAAGKEGRQGITKPLIKSPYENLILIAEGPENIGRDKWEYVQVE